MFENSIFKYLLKDLGDLTKKRSNHPVRVTYGEEWKRDREIYVVRNRKGEKGWVNAKGSQGESQ